MALQPLSLHDLHLLSCLVGDYVTFRGKAYRLASVQFHTPSSHSINYQNYDMEVHFVHQAADPAHGECILRDENYFRTLEKASHFW